MATQAPPPDPLLGQPPKLNDAENLLPKKIHALTQKGFLLKAAGFRLAHHFLFLL